MPDERHTLTVLARTPAWHPRGLSGQLWMTDRRIEKTQRAIADQRAASRGCGSGRREERQCVGGVDQACFTTTISWSLDVGSCCVSKSSRCRIQIGEIVAFDAEDEVVVLRMHEPSVR